MAVSEPGPRSDHALSDEGHVRLKAALHDLRTAVGAYEKLRSIDPLVRNRAASAADVERMRAAQEAIEAAEDRLWHVREELLGWARPSWAPSASLTSDWFSDEDSVYDDAPGTTAP